ncbi:MAG: hypothetical protein A2Y64_00400 [Candidatus Coatesbacteria bacterium RBG_13_66_14]|uniref:Secretion system C-terminal sorting domain-containing protein n=1 Tax=Candidatus Coatesbacteria bacterium RBG_13_66_14 TaxID=1817816 RepID=A0A1F5F593_9BACT|nr:MAG: hypothetical protein A2Y64_00400 [Candidatus Coatesbacteria bacterium RBG_13_66_14]
MKRLFLALAPLLVVGAVFAEGWESEYVDEDGGDVGWYSSLAIDSSDHPHIAYHCYSDESLKYARWDGSDWHIETVDDDGSTGYCCALALDSHDWPHIAYYRSTGDNTLKYAHWNGSAWVIEDLYTDGVQAICDIAVDSHDCPHILFHVGFAPCWYLRYTYWDGAEWQMKNFDPEIGNTWDWGAIALDSNDCPHIVVPDMYARSYMQLAYLHQDGGDWQVEIVDGNSGYDCSIAMDSDDHPWISYGCGSENLRCAAWNGGSWDIYTVDPDCRIDCYTCYQTSIAVDGRDWVHISYRDEYTHSLNYALWDGSRWWLDMVEGNNAGQFSSIAVDSSGAPCISHRKNMEGKLKYAHYSTLDVDVVGFDAESVDGSSVLLSWSVEASAGDELSYCNLYRREAGAVESANPIGELINPNPIFGDGSLHYLDCGVETGRTYEYYLRVYADDALFHEFGPVEVECVAPTGEFALFAPYPNPVQSSVTLCFNLPQNGSVELTVYDLAGRRVDILVAGDLAAGRHEASWEAGGFPAGVYLVRLATDYGSLTRRLVVAR